MAASASLTGGFHRQAGQDLDGDGWLDMAKYDRWTVRPRLFLEGSQGAKAFVTLGATTEDRRGGTYRGAPFPTASPIARRKRPSGSMRASSPKCRSTASARPTSAPRPCRLPRQAIDGRWAVDVWAPTDGVVVNGGVRFSLGG